jgi:succinyl-CoA synthetase beta subunit
MCQLNLHEHQAKELFVKYQIPTNVGRVAFTADEAKQIAQEYGQMVVIKAQVLTGGRGKAGGVKLAKTPDEAHAHASKILGMTIKGLVVHKVLVAAAADITKEIYLSITNDRAAGRPTIIASYEGGVEIEEVAKTNPDAIIRELIDPVLGLHPYQAVEVASRMKLPREHWRAFGDILMKLYECFKGTDATLAEINPLVITGDNKLVALDGKVSIDDNSMYRHKEFEAYRDTTAEAPSETQAREAGIAYVKLDGQIGCMVNGAGLAMATMDMTKLYGGDNIGPANFLDIGGGAQADKVAAALHIILSDPNVKSVLINIFGGITRCDEVARGMLTAYEQVKPSVPIVIRLVGTNAEEGRAIIDQARIPNLSSAATLTDAAKQAVASAKGN